MAINYDPGPVGHRNDKNPNIGKEIDEYEELVNSILPIIDEINHLKKLVDEKTFKEITKKIR